MDLSHCLVLGFVILGLTQGAKKVFPNLEERFVPIVCLAIAVGSTFLVAHSIWGSSEVFADQPLKDLNWPSLLVVSVAAWGVAMASWAGLKTIANIGEKFSDKL